jgi:hypothetical protein
MDSFQEQIIKEHKERQEKFVYYLIALAVSSIGFSVYNTLNIKLNITQIPLGIALFCWGASIFCGITFLKVTLSILYDNNRYFDIENGLDSDIGKDPQKIKIALSSFKPILIEKASKVSKYFNWQIGLFYIGIILFLFWHVIEMYLY